MFQKYGKFEAFRWNISSSINLLFLKSNFLVKFSELKNRNRLTKDITTFNLVFATTAQTTTIVATTAANTTI